MFEHPQVPRLKSPAGQRGPIRVLGQLSLLGRGLCPRVPSPADQILRPRGPWQNLESDPQALSRTCVRTPGPSAEPLSGPPGPQQTFPEEPQTFAEQTLGPPDSSRTCTGTPKAPAEPLLGPPGLQQTFPEEPQAPRRTKFRIPRPSAENVFGSLGSLTDQSVVMGPPDPTKHVSGPGPQQRMCLREA